jgi:hypothetical protein
MFRRLDNPLLNRLQCGNHPFVYEGLYRTTLRRPTGDTLPKNCIMTLRVLRKLRKKTFSGLIPNPIALRTV